MTAKNNKNNNDNNKEAKTNPLSILIIDDNDVFFVLTEKILPDCKVEYAGNADEGIKKFKELKPDIVLLDIRMPGENGHEALKKIMAINNKAFVIMMSASRVMEDIELSQKEGAQGYIMKPFSSDRMRKCVQQYYDYVGQNDVT